MLDYAPDCRHKNRRRPGIAEFVCATVIVVAIVATVMEAWR